MMWTLIDDMVRRGNHFNVAIDRIYAVYGHISVTDLYKRIKADERNGGHPDLIHN